jgi:predicted amidohydrolase
MTVSTDEKLRIATCQFHVTDDIRANQAAVEGAVAEAASRGADLVHFCEAALSGYPGTDLYSWDGFDWETLRAAVTSVQACARKHGVWVVVGSAHPLEPGANPTNCVYIISPRGEIHDRYDKCMLTLSDQMFYAAGDHRVVLELKGVRLGFLICYDACFPEMYAAYRNDGVTVMLHSFYNAGFGGENILDEVGPAWIRVRAADNQMHVVANNSSRPHSSWSSCVARPDGSLAAALPVHTPGVLVHEFPDEELKGWLHNNKPIRLASDEVFHQGEQSAHARVKNRQSPP